MLGFQMPNDNISKESLHARKVKGLNIVAQEDIVQKSESVFAVKGSKNKVYTVIYYKPNVLGQLVIEERWTCDCWDFKARGRKNGVDCKHITASKVYVTLNGKW